MGEEGNPKSAIRYTSYLLISSSDSNKWFLHASIDEKCQASVLHLNGPPKHDKHLNQSQKGIVLLKNRQKYQRAVRLTYALAVTGNNAAVSVISHCMYLSKYACKYFISTLRSCLLTLELNSEGEFGVVWPPNWPYAQNINFRNNIRLPVKCHLLVCQYLQCPEVALTASIV